MKAPGRGDEEYFRSGVRSTRSIPIYLTPPTEGKFSDGHDKHPVQSVIHLGNPGWEGIRNIFA
jgi:hypothetical protein